jgi:hypothetical protein
VARRFFQCGALTDRCVGAAARLPESERKDLAILALARSERVSDLAARHRVSRKFVYQQTHKARVALDGAFLSAVPEGEVLFEMAVTKTWLNQVIVALPLICHSSYRGVVEFMRDLLGIPISVGAVHHVLQSATRQADLINNGQDLSGIRVGLHDEIFHGPIPVLAGVAFLDVRTAVLNDTLADAFRHRYPGFRPANDDEAVALTS